VLTIGHITDLHLDGTESSRRRLILVIDAFLSHARRVDALVITGDVVEVGDAEDPQAEYEFARAQTERLGVPTLWCAGNSDGADPEGFGGAITLPGLTILALDSHVPGSFAGAFDDEQLVAAREALAGHRNNDSSVLLALHHPPVALGHETVDGIRLLDADPLAALVTEQPSVVGILAGHTHAACSSTFAGVPLVLAQGVHSNGQLPLDIREPWSDLIDETAEPAYAVHLVIEGRLVSYFRTVPPPD